jgi:polar amino acid transport system substrate-binding protein
MFRLILLLCLAGAASAETLSIRADPWCPYNCQPDSAQPGYMIEIAQAVFGPSGYTIDYQTLNWSRALKETAEGRYTAVVGAGRQEIAQYGLVAPQNPLGKNQNCFFVNPEQGWRYTGPASLKGRSIGTIQDYSYGEALDAAFKANPGIAQTMTGDEGLRRNIEKLQAKRLDAVLENRDVFTYKTSLLKLQGRFKEAGCDQTPDEGVFIAFSPKHPKAKTLAAQLDAGVQRMRRDGSLQRILDKYSVKMW